MDFIPNLKQSKLTEMPHVARDVVEQPGQQAWPKMSQVGRKRIHHSHRVLRSEAETRQFSLAHKRVVIDLAETLSSQLGPNAAQVHSKRIGRRHHGRYSGGLRWDLIVTNHAADLFHQVIF